MNTKIKINTQQFPSDTVASLRLLDVFRFRTGTVAKGMDISEDSYLMLLRSPQPGNEIEDYQYLHRYKQPIATIVVKKLNLQLCNLSKFDSGDTQSKSFNITVSADEPIVKCEAQIIINP